MAARPPGAQEFVPATADLAVLADAAQGCKGCDLYLDATQTVFGAGSAVLLGATAAKALMGNDFRVTAHRGEVLRLPQSTTGPDFDPQVVATVHPSSVLRGPPEDRENAFDGLTADLRVAADLLGQPRPK